MRGSDVGDLCFAPRLCAEREEDEQRKTEYHLAAFHLVQRAVAEEEEMFHTVQGLLSLQEVSVQP